MTLGHLSHTIAGLADAFTISQSRFKAYQDWAHELFSLISNNQQESLSFQNHIWTSFKSFRDSIPAYICNRFHAYDGSFRTWRGNVESIITRQSDDLLSLVNQLNTY